MAQRTLFGGSAGFRRGFLFRFRSANTCRFFRKLLCLFILLWTVNSLAQNILLSDFEQTNYVWLPGSLWAVTGTAFGTGPAQGTLPKQQSVTGYLGHGLVDSYNGGDGSTGTLTSPPFTIQRKYIRFLIGGGNRRSQTCMNLVVNGHVVRSSVGMGDREALGWLQWNVSNYLNQTAQIEIVDAATGSWGHINVDQILETDTALAGTFTASEHYLNFPIQTGAPMTLVEVIQNGLVVREMNVELAQSTTNFWAFMDLTPFQGQELLLRVNSQLATANQLATDFIQTNTIITKTPIYQEALRPIYHYTARRGWNNDANGLVYFNGKYHLCYQHNPYGVSWDNMHWGQAVSTDLVHWQELPEALYPDSLGTEYSGSAVVDWNNSAGFGTNALLAFYCSAGDQNRMSKGQPFTQCMAYSLDQGQTWIKYTNNPIIPNVVGENRDPKVFWYAQGRKWVMALYLNNNDYGLFSSTDLKHWTQTSTFAFPGSLECPELFPLPLDGNTNNLRWIFWSANGRYDVGQFDGDTFTPQYGPFTINSGNDFYAAQTFNNIPAADGRRIMIAWAYNGRYPGMPFNCGMTFPVQLTLGTTGTNELVYVNPVEEIADLRTSTNRWPEQTLASGVNVMSGTTGEAYELDALFEPGTATNIIFTLGDTKVTYNNVNQQVSCGNWRHALSPSNGLVDLHILVDRGIVEIYGNEGLLYMPVSVPPVSGALPVGLVAGGNGARLVSLKMYNLGSAWPPAPPFISRQPVLTTNIDLGGSATFSVTATGTTVPIFYQWLCNGEPVAGATNSTLTVIPASATNLNYDVVISNSAGSVTSSVAHLTVRGPYIVADWQMEGQITAPNKFGTPTWPGVADSATLAGQGIYTPGTLPASIDDLITFNGLAGQPVTLSTNVAPSSMFVNGHTGGNYSYNSGAIADVNGCLFFPQDQYGDEVDFTGSFSVELFFKTDGDQSGTSKMELFCEGSDVSGFPSAHFRYGIDVNEAGPGSVRFAVVNSSLSETNIVDLTNANYADGQWHYLLAVCDARSGTNGQLRLTIVNQDRSEAQATTDLPADFLPLPTEDDGNAFVGRYTYPVGSDPRTFLGLIDEVQVTAGVVPDYCREGKIPSIDNHIRISGISVGTNGLSFQWAGAAATNFLVQWEAQLDGHWQTIATLPSTDDVRSFVDTNTTQFLYPTGFYRIVGQ